MSFKDYLEENSGELYSEFQDIRRDLTEISSRLSSISSKAKKEKLSNELKLAKSIEKKIDEIRNDIFNL